MGYFGSKATSGLCQLLVAVEMRGYLANSPRELTVPVEANQR